MSAGNQTHGAVEAWLTWAFSPTISAIIATLLVATLLPIIIHFYLYNTAKKGSSTPTFLLIGPSGAGKTSLLTLFANTTPTPTHTSQTTTTALCKLSPTARSAADRYRSENDTSERDLPTFQLIDTPGHGKLRHHAYTHFVSSSSDSASAAPKGILFVLDAAAPSLSDAAAYLHDILLALQQRRTAAKTSKLPAAIPVLIAANKQDVFTALPAPVVRQRLQEEIGKIRASRSRGLLDSAAQGDDGAGMGGEEDDEEGSWLGEFGSKRFVFEQLIEFGVEVTVAGGNVLAEGEEDGGRRVQEWWDWIAENL